MQKIVVYHNEQYDTYLQFIYYTIFEFTLSIIYDVEHITKEKNNDSKNLHILYKKISTKMTYCIEKKGTE